MAKGAYIGVPEPTRRLRDVSVGETIFLLESGNPVEYLVVNQGIPSNNSMYHSSCNGTWLLRKEIYTTYKWHNTAEVNKYHQSQFHTYLNSTFLSLFDETTQAAIIQAQIPIWPQVANTGVLENLSAKIFLLSAEEVGRQDTLNTPDGALLSYFIKGITNEANSLRIGYLNNVATEWSLRSPIVESNNHASVEANGAVGMSMSTSATGVRPAMIMDGNIGVFGKTVTGEAYTLEGNSVARKIKKGYIGVGKYTNSIGDLEVGSIVKNNENGSPVEFYVATHDYESGLNGAGRTLLVRKASWSTKMWWQDADGSENSTNMIYANSTIDKWLNGTYKQRFDVNLQSQMSTTFYYTSGKNDPNLKTHTASIFLLSAQELNQVKGNIISEGSTLPVVNQIINNGSKYYLRTINYYYGCPSYIDGSGTLDISNSIQGSPNSPECYPRPCFTLPSTLSVSSDGLITGDQASTIDIARKIKKAYIGIGGVARPCWSGGELAAYGSITGLSAARYWLAATNVGTYALFGGGYTGSAYSTAVDAYNGSLVRTSTAKLSAGRQALAAASLGDYAIFGGGDSGNSVYNRLDGFNSSLTSSNVSLLPNYHTNLAATAVGNYAIFAGGRSSSSSTGALTAARAFDSSLTANTNINNLNANAFALAATTIGDYALFGGGASGSTYQTAMTAYTASLTRSTPTALTQGRSFLTATSVGNYALFAGGYNSNTSPQYVATVDVYDTSLTRSTPTALSVGRRQLCATSLGKYAIVCGGQTPTEYNTIDVYDDTLTRTTDFVLSVARYRCGAATVGNYALVGGGYGSSASAVVDAYTIA